MPIMLGMSYGEWVRKQRERKGLTQDQLAATVGCHINTIGNIERGAVVPIPAHRTLLATIFGQAYKEADHEDPKEAAPG